MRTLLSIADYMYNPHSNDVAIPIGEEESSSTTSSSSSSLDPSFYPRSSSSSSSNESSSSSSMGRGGRKIRSRRSYSSSGYYDESSEENGLKSNTLSYQEVGKDQKLVSKWANHFNVSVEGLYDIYMTFKYLNYDVSSQSERNELYCGLRILPPTVYTQHNIMVFDDSKYAVKFHSIHKEQNKALLCTLNSNIQHKSDTYIVEQKIHDILYFTISRALVERIIRVSNPSRDLIDIFTVELPHVHSKHSMSHVHCKNKTHLESRDIPCLNNRVIYTKTTSKLYLFIKSILNTKFSSIEGHDNISYNECEFALPLPFYLVLFLCGNSTDFKSEYNIGGLKTTTTTIINNTNGIASHTIDAYIDYEKWVCLPFWCLLMYQNVK